MLGVELMSTPKLSTKAPQLILAATMLTTVVLMGSSWPSLSAPLHPVAPFSIEASDGEALIIPARAGARGGRVAVGPRGGAVVHRGAAVVGPRGGAAVRRT